MILLAALLSLLPCSSVTARPENVSSFAELDGRLEPDGFSLLLVCGWGEETDSLRTELLAAVERVAEVDSAFRPDLYQICTADSGHAEVVLVLGLEPPSVVGIVGNCGYLVLDIEFLESEITDIWQLWGAEGSSRSSGICRLCRRCATTGECTYREGE